MEKRRPHYRLANIQEVVADPATQPFTATALRGGLALGLTEPEMRKVVLSLSRRDFYKAMTTQADHQVWQDVYHGMRSDGVPVYIKITGYVDGRPPVIQFKAK
jgi:motility quorum-sensing regulator / GCU-specific mRNA interferase toxin